MALSAGPGRYAGIREQASLRRAAGGACDQGVIRSLEVQAEERAFCEGMKGDGVEGPGNGVSVAAEEPLRGRGAAGVLRRHTGASVGLRVTDRTHEKAYILDSDFSLQDVTSGCRGST